MNQRSRKDLCLLMGVAMEMSVVCMYCGGVEVAGEDRRDDSE